MNESKRKDLENDQKKILGAKVRYRLFLSKTPVLFRKSVIKYPMGVSFARCKKENEEYAADGI